MDQLNTILKNKSMRTLVYLFLTSVLFAASCEKKDPNPAQFYIRCKIDGQDYWPNGCANCMRGQLLGDTIFLMNANAGFQSVSIGIIKLDKVPISMMSYILDDNLQQNGHYDHSPLVNDIFKTGSTNTGELKITILDKANKIIAGTFFLKRIILYKIKP
ncbi:MAG: hypothetical protein EAZ41_08185 [Sphingobacteriia bacterium]|nr:MAG: hypothetical protein EAZ41_08185 [Sphingobacteriia bacterium]